MGQRGLNRLNLSDLSGKNANLVETGREGVLPLRVIPGWESLLSGRRQGRAAFGSRSIGGSSIPTPSAPRPSTGAAAESGASVSRCRCDLEPPPLGSPHRLRLRAQRSPQLVPHLNCHLGVDTFTQRPQGTVSRVPASRAAALPSSRGSAVPSAPSGSGSGAPGRSRRAWVVYALS